MSLSRYLMHCQHEVDHSSIIITLRGGCVALQDGMNEVVAAQLAALREQGAPLTVPLARSAIISILRRKEPELLAENDGPLKVGRTFVGEFLRGYMGWTDRLLCFSSEAACVRLATVFQQQPHCGEWSKSISITAAPDSTRSEDDSSLLP